MEENKFIELKDKLIADSTKNGYISLEKLNQIFDQLSKEQQKQLIDELPNLKVMSELEAYHNELKSTGRKRAFSYYLLICKILGIKASVEEFKPKIVFYQKTTVDEYLETECDENEKNIIRMRYGLDSGEPEKDVAKISEKLCCPSEATFIKTYHTALSKIEPGYKKYDHLVNSLNSMMKYGSIQKYKFCKIEMEDSEEDASMFSPLKRGEECCGGYYAYYFSDESRQIGWILKPTYFAHNMTFYGDDVWGVRTFNDKQRPNVHMHYEDNKLYFEFYYSSVGYQGNRYIFEPNKQTIVQVYNKGKLEKEYSLDFVLNTNLDQIFTLPKIEEKEVKRDDKAGLAMVHTTDHNDGEAGITFTTLFYGRAIIGQTINTKYNGLCLTNSIDEDSFRYYNKLEETDENKFRNSAFVEVVSYETGSPKIVFGIDSLNDTKYLFLYNPFATADQMIVFEKSADNTIVNKAVLSNPFFKKSTNQELILEKNEAETKLNSLIGLQNVKEQIKRLKAICHKNKGRDEKLNLNMVFTGNPGTGKTIVARLVANILYDEGILSNNTFIEVDRAGLVAEYIGQSEKKVADLLEKAKGGVLFIDEAYSLYSSEFDSKDYGQKVIDILVKAMEDMRGKICIIFAGYDKPMQKMMNMNIGFKSRVNRKIEFKDYSIEELRDIAKMFLKDNEYICSEGTLDEMMSIVESKMKETNFDNARCVRNILESLYEIQSVRTYDEIDDREITTEDVNEYKNEIHFIKKEKKEYSYKFKKTDINDLQLDADCITINDKYLKTCSLNIKNYYKNEVDSEGSGFFISSTGLICTCAHVIKDDCDDIRAIVNIETNNGKVIQKEYKAHVIGKDSKTDVGILKINEPDIDFNYYLIAQPDYKAELRTDICMAGYPLGGERFKDISINEGKIQSYNKDANLDEENELDKIYVDINGASGCSGSGVIDYSSKQVIGIFAGASIGYSKPVVFELNYCIPTKYIWELIDALNNKGDK